MELVKAKELGSNLLEIADVSLETYVLDDDSETRVFTQSTILDAFNISSGRNGGRLLEFVKRDSLFKYASPHLVDLIENHIEFTLPKGGKAHGFDVTVIPEFCRLIIKANQDGALKSTQSHIAERALELQMALAGVGIIALVDEATGFQEKRPLDALRKYLAQMLSPELVEWQKTFPDEFYTELYQLCGFEGNPLRNRPDIIGTLTNNYVYSRLGPNIEHELKARTPRNAKGNRTKRFHQWLTTHTGYIALQKHLSQVILLMKMAKGNRKQFEDNLDEHFPKYQFTPLLDPLLKGEEMMKLPLFRPGQSAQPAQ